MKTLRAFSAAERLDFHEGIEGHPEDLAPLLTLSEVAALLKLNARTVRRMVAEQRLPCVRIGRQLRFAPVALSRWLQAREEG